ncbi:hypothetical protein BVI434_370026 [Burkholderia vietnamiensis]|nr:hypothetical protein BVI434_370026 [Burkholderia vietnamiensis]
MLAPTPPGRGLCGRCDAQHLDEASLFSNEHRLVFDFTRSRQSIAQPRVALMLRNADLPI